MKPASSVLTFLQEKGSAIERQTDLENVLVQILCTQCTVRPNKPETLETGAEKCLLQSHAWRLVAQVPQSPGICESF